MPLDPPDLDTRDFDELYREARLRATVYAPEWTDFNDSDPGATLLQLFCWLTEMTLHQLNQVPLRNYVKFLQLLGLELAPAQPARAHLTFTAATDGVVDPVPRRARVEAEAPGDEPPPVFETETGLDLIPYALTDVRVTDGSGAPPRPVDNEPGSTFRPLGWQPQPGSALYLGLLPRDEPPTPVLPPRLSFRIFLAPSPGTVATPARPSAQLQWEYKPGPGERWRRLEFEDETAAFTREGYMQVDGPREGPADLVPTVEAGIQEARYWLRCRLIGGGYAVGREPEIEFLRPNTVPAENLVTIEDETLGRSEGRAGETFHLRFRPVRAEDLELVVRDGTDDTEPWMRRDDLYASGEDDRHYVLNATTGEVRFGDGRHGRLPRAGAEVVALRYRYGGGDAGNVGAGAISTLLSGVAGVESVTNPRPAVGGRDEERLGELQQRAPAILRRGGRAVTADDFASLAAGAGGIARATALANRHPDHPGVPVPGAVTVVVMPDSDAAAPEPSPDELEAVERHLEQFRLITTELLVRPPRYIGVSVEAQVSIRPHASPGAVQRSVSQALDAALDPKPRPDGTGGRPFGLDLYPTSLLAVAQGAEDVVAVPSLSVTAGGRRYALDERIEVPADGLLYGAGHTITATTYRERAV